MPTRHGPFLSENTDVLVPSNSESEESGMLIFRFERLAELILAHYHEHKFEYIGAKSSYALSGWWGRLLDSEYTAHYGKNTVEFMHWQVRKRLVSEGKLSGWNEYESVHLPPKFAKLSYQQIADTLLWYAQYLDREERELIMEFLLTDGRCGGGWNEYNEQNKRVQAILSQVANSYLVQQFPKE